MLRLSLLALCVSLTFSLPMKNHVTKLKTLPLKYSHLEQSFRTNNRIINGENAENTPWVARIITNMDDGAITSNCGGSLIEPNWVLSARHCFFNDDNEMACDNFWVSVGEVDFVNGQIIHVDEIFVINEENNDDDIALCRLSDNADGIDPIPVQYEDNIDYTDQEATIYGWGQTETGKGSDVLKTTNVVLWGREDCEENSVCLNPEITNTNACSGDSGGPMVLNVDGEIRLIGVTSRVSVVNDEPCTGDKTWYTSTSFYGDWIQQVID